LKDFIWDIF